MYDLKKECLVTGEFCGCKVHSLNNELNEKKPVVLFGHALWRKSIKLVYGCNNAYSEEQISRLCSSFTEWVKENKGEKLKMRHLVRESKSNFFFTHHRGLRKSSLIFMLY